MSHRLYYYHQLYFLSCKTFVPVPPRPRVNNYIIFLFAQLSMQLSYFSLEHGANSVNHGVHSSISAMCQFITCYGDISPGAQNSCSNMNLLVFAHFTAVFLASFFSTMLNITFIFYWIPVAWMLDLSLPPSFTLLLVSKYSPRNLLSKVT